MTNSGSAKEINVVVIGISHAGMEVSKTLASFAKTQHLELRVTMVDQRSYFYHNIAMPRALVDSKTATSISFSLDGLLDQYEQDPGNPKHRFIQAAVTSITTTSVELSNGSSVPFDYLVLSTGVSSTFPATITVPTIPEANEQLTQVHANVEKAKQVLVIGGGAVGVEAAGEIADAYPDKKVTLVHSGPHLLPDIFKPTVLSGALAKLQALGVRVVLNEKVNIPENTVFDCSVRPLDLQGASGNVYQSDLQILATGAKPNAGFIQGLEGTLGTKLRDDRGYIKVRPTLQLDSDACSNIFVPGDVNNMAAGAKYAILAKQQAELVSGNIKALVTASAGGKTVALKQWDGRVANSCVIPIGRTRGVGQLLGVSLGSSWFADFTSRNLKGKDYFVSFAAKGFKNSK
ncbi:hypothetical protein LPJ72_003934 [Coemansia sp. Benny D160-2]|nr:hypothetical protein LPJ72_003934 [Coemansia sp. Benny D160-2]